MLSEHARRRAQERLGLSAEESNGILMALWRDGRKVSPADFLQFGTYAMAGFDYRVVVWRTRLVLIVRAAATGVFVTVFATPRKRRRML